MKMGKNFLLARKKIGIDQKNAAAALGISAPFLSKIEKDKKKPSIDLILKAAKLYGVEEGFFFKDYTNVNLDDLYTDENKTFINDLESLTTDQLQSKYNIKLDGKELTPNEIKGIIAYVRSLRSMND